MEPFLLRWYSSLIFSHCILFTSVDMYVHHRVALSKTKHEVLKFNYFEKNTIMVHTENMNILCTIFSGNSCHHMTLVIGGIVALSLGAVRYLI